MIFLALILFSFEQITFGEIEKETIKLKKILPTEEKLEEITHSTIWKYIDKQVSSNEELALLNRFKFYSEMLVEHMIQS